MNCYKLSDETSADKTRSRMDHQSHQRQESLVDHPSVSDPRYPGFHLDLFGSTDYVCDCQSERKQTQSNYEQLLANSS